MENESPALLKQTDTTFQTLIMQQLSKFSDSVKESGGFIPRRQRSTLYWLLLKFDMFTINNLLWYFISSVKMLKLRVKNSRWEVRHT